MWHHPPQFPTGRQLSPQHSGSGGRGAVRQDASHVHGSGTVLNPPRRRLHVWRSPQLAATRSGGRQLGRQRQRLTGAVGQACRRPWWMAAPPPPPAAAWAAQPKRILAVTAATVATAVAAVQIAAAATPAPAPEAEVAAATTAPPQLQTAALTFNDAQLLAATPPALSPSTWCWRRSKSGQRPAPPPLLRASHYHPTWGAAMAASAAGHATPGRTAQRSTHPRRGAPAVGGCRPQPPAGKHQSASPPPKKPPPPLLPLPPQLQPPPPPQLPPLAQPPSPARRSHPPVRGRPRQHSPSRRNRRGQPASSAGAQARCRRRPVGL